MATPGGPIVPPRPQKDSQTRLQQQAASNAAGQLELPADAPVIPPRPLHKALSRSESPSNYPQSPLNEPYGLSKRKSRDPIPRPPSVSRFPTSGEEGMEYGEIQSNHAPTSAIGTDSAAQTVNVGQDVQLHAPKPSLPKTSATAQVQAVTRTDTGTAASHGFGRPSSAQDDDGLGRVRSRTSFSRPGSAASRERRGSIYAEDQEHGPAGIGMRVPINPLLGDVQAPSPGPSLSPHHTGHGHDTGKKRNHTRTRSGREQFLPPDSYGLHGHGLAPQDRFERDWYAKHPEEAHNEEVSGHGVYESIGSGRGSFALSSDDLNKIVRDSARSGHGFGITGKTVSYPDEQIGYAASEEYSKQQLPALSKVPSNTVQPALASPLRNASFPVDRTLSPEIHRGSQEHLPLDRDVPDVHIHDPDRKYNKVTGGEETMKETRRARSYVSHGTDDDEEDDEYKVPILAEDEVAKENRLEHMQPAVSPMYQRRGSAYGDEYGYSSSPHGSRPSSRPGSVYNMHSASHSLSRITSHHDDRDHLHTPLEDVDEYEPLFPEDDDKKKYLSHAERFKKRPDMLRHKFPSQDIWEDTPDSVMYEATVSTPDLPKPETSSTTSAFEPPEVERGRKGEIPEEEKKRLIPADDRLAKSKFAPHLRDDMPTRPGLPNRFPSQDIWEDSPDSQNLVTTVNDAADEPALSHTPAIPARPAKSRLGNGASSAQVEPSVTPNVPPRTQQQVHAVPPFGAKLTEVSSSPETAEARQAPSVSDRPKPQVPARPAKKADSDSVSKVTSAESQDSAEADRSVPSPPVPKAKPQVPAKPSQGSKIASLRSNFMNDLNQKLGLGPPKEKEPEPLPQSDEAKPLEDARKSRARGPQRRAPAKSPNTRAGPPLSFSIAPARSIWNIDDSGVLTVSVAQVRAQLSQDKLEQIGHSTPGDAPPPSTIDTTTKAGYAADHLARADGAKSQAPVLATNTAGEHPDPVPAGARGPVSEQSTGPDAGDFQSRSTMTTSDGTDVAASTGGVEKPAPESDLTQKKLEDTVAEADSQASAEEQGPST